ncbi:MAG: hypothetical protein PHC70_05360 [Patescibacteria group bacterium]|nr:hypothetical protein [Patescibacteria group bacterium]
MGDKKLKKLSALVVLIVGLGLVLPTCATLAQAAPQGLQAISAGAKKAAGGAGLAGSNSPDMITLIGQLIGAVMGLVGVLLFGYMVYGGFKWMTAAGDQKNVTEAISIIRNAIIGIVIIVAAYAISNYVIGTLANTQTGNLTQTPAKQ